MAAKVALILVGLTTAVGTVFWLGDWWYAKQVRDFCETIQSEDDGMGVRQRALSEGLKAEYTGDRKLLVIMPGSGWYYNPTCSVKLEEDQVVDWLVIGR